MGFGGFTVSVMAMVIALGGGPDADRDSESIVSNLQDLIEVNDLDPDDVMSVEDHDSGKTVTFQDIDVPVDLDLGVNVGGMVLDIDDGDEEELKISLELPDEFKIFNPDHFSDNSDYGIVSAGGNVLDLTIDRDNGIATHGLIDLADFSVFIPESIDPTWDSDFTLDAERVVFDGQLSPGEDDLWGWASALEIGAMTTGDEDMDVSVGSLDVTTEVHDIDLATVMEHRDELGMRDDLDINSGGAWYIDVAEVEASGPDHTLDGSMNSGWIGFEVSGFGDDGLTVSGGYGVDGLDILSLWLPPELVPSQSRFEFTLEDGPTLDQMPELGAIMFMGPDPYLTAFEESGGHLTLGGEAQAEVAGFDFESDFTADSAMPLGGVGELTMAVRNFGDLVEVVQGLDPDAAGALTMFQMMGDQSEEGLHRYHFEIKESGELLLNGNDLEQMMGAFQ